MPDRKRDDWESCSLLSSLNHAHHSVLVIFRQSEVRLKAGGDVNIALSGHKDRLEVVALLPQGSGLFQSHYKQGGGKPIACQAVVSHNGE